MKINSLDTLSSEKIRLQNEAESMTASLTNDVEMIKKAIQPWALIHRAVTAIIPEVLMKSKITGVPINFILKTIFGEKTAPGKPADPAEEKKQHIKSVALGIVETAAMILLNRGIKKGFGKR